MTSGGQGSGRTRSEGCGHSGHGRGQAPIQTESEAHPARPPGLGRAIRREAGGGRAGESLLVGFWA